ncbi:hypothetical protein [Chryseobacterium tongliaoense]|uniref:hypothetical protein n=1 Tax=Chryseobacterium tongliaoense TaxID=3240933 RepID=UPI0035110270
MDIISKFTIGSDEGVADLLTIKTTAINNLYKEKVPDEEIKNYIGSLDSRKMINELNDLSNQLIITYLNEQPIAYSILKSGSVYPGYSEEKRITELNFVILQEFDTQEVRQSLWKKTRSAISFTDIVWMNIVTHDPLLEFMKESGFSVAEDSTMKPFSLPAYLLKMEL